MALPSYLRDDPKEEAAALAQRLMQRAGLDQAQAQQLAILARALSRGEGSGQVRRLPSTLLPCPRGRGQAK